MAEIFRTALDLEDANIIAKKYRGSTYSDHYYDEKEDLLVNLIGLCREGEDILYGYQYTDGDYAYINAVMYFDLPGCEQISFHYQGLAYFKALMSGTNSPAVTSRSCFKNIVIYTGR